MISPAWPFITYTPGPKGSSEIFFSRAPLIFHSCSTAAVKRAGAFISFLAVGCIPLPYASPPLKLRAAGGAFIDENPATPDKTSPLFDLTIGAHPQQLFTNALVRRFDLGAGYRLETPLSARLRHGPYVEGSWLFAQADERKGRGVLHAS